VYNNAQRAGQGRAGHSQIKCPLRQGLGCLFGGMLSSKGKGRPEILLLNAQ